MANEPTTTELKNFYNNNKDRIERYASAETALNQLVDLTKTTTKTISSFDKSSLSTYLQNIGSNEKNLRNLSRYLYYRCNPYMRLIKYNANMFCLYARSVIPEYDLIGDNDKDNILKNYQDTLDILDRMDLQYEFFKTYITAFREDVFYGCAYLDEEGFFIYPIDPDYCRIAGIYDTGDFAFAMNMEYFKGSNSYLLEYLSEPFQSMYNAYNGVNSQKWQIMPSEYAVCLKQRAEDWQSVIPPYTGIFNSLLNLLSAEDIQAISDEQDVYKMLWIELETISGSKNPDDWKVDPNLVVKYFNRMVEEALPAYTTAAIVPGKLETVEFENTYTTETNKVSTATETLFNTSGGAQILNSSTITGTTAFTAAMKSDTEFAISSLLPQTQAIVNRLIKSKLSNACFVKFMPVSVYTKDIYKESLLQDGTYGLPVKLMINSLNNFTEKETMALNYLENEVLNLNEVFVPLNSSHTQSSSDNTKPELDDDELTDDGEASRDKSDNAN